MSTKIFSFSHVPQRSIILTAGLSYLTLFTAILLGYPLWVVALVAFAPWLPLLTSEVVYDYRHYAWLAVFEALLLLQFGQFAEHLAQIVQIFLLHFPPEQANGIFGQVNREWVLFLWNTALLAGIVVLALRWPRNRALWVAAVVAAWVEIEMIVIVITYVSTGIVGSPGLLGRGGVIGTPLLRPDLHFIYSLTQTGVLIWALVAQLRTAHDEWLERAFPTFTPEQLAWASSQVETRQVKAGQDIVRQGELADNLYIIASGEVEVIRDSNGERRVVGKLSRGQFFGEVGVVGGKPRNATVRAVTDCDLLALDGNTFRRMLSVSEQTREAVEMIMKARE
ncbi:MAG: cyclic nucleotide-binding domain-containing protein [Chloroflexi bacterium]|nr:cyclic nucleotide-binding domain-containing protein [Chloroflexota bacterium]